MWKPVVLEMIGQKIKVKNEQKIKLISDTCQRRDKLFLVIFRSYHTNEVTRGQLTKLQKYDKLSNQYKMLMWTKKQIWNVTILFQKKKGLKIISL